MDTEISEACVGFWNCISPDAWLTASGTLIGAFLGAFLAGRYTLTSVQKQLRNNDLQKRKQEILSHLKVSADILAITKALSSRCNELLDYLKANIALEPDFDFHARALAENCAMDLDKAGKQLKMVDYHLVPYESYNGYLAAREIVFLLGPVVDRISLEIRGRIGTDQMDSTIHFKTFEEYLTKLDFILEKLDKANSDEEKEYELIKSKIIK